MFAPRAYRLIESSFVVLFLVESARAVYGVLLAMTQAAITARQVSLLTVNGHLILIAALAVPWFAPRARGQLPRTLLISALMATVARVLVSVDIPFLRLAAGCAVIGFAAVYMASLLRANWRTWVSGMVVGLVWDQLLRSQDTYDISLKGLLRISIGDATFAVPWLVLQIVIAVVAIIVCLQARRSARNQLYEPAFLDVWGGLALGGFLTIEMLVLGTPSVIARWTGTTFGGVAPWILLATALPLIPSVRASMSQFLKLFDERLRGWVILLLVAVLTTAGNRLGSSFGAAALVIAQFLVVLLLWWIPGSYDAQQVEQVGPSVSLAMIVFAAGVYGYGLTMLDTGSPAFLRGQGLTILLIAAILTAFPRLWWRERDPWQLQTAMPTVLPVALCAVVVVGSVISSSADVDVTPQTPMNTLRIATYNVTSGYDGDGTFQLELIARTIEASQADVIVLQEVDTGRPIDFEIDQVEFLARRLRMYQTYQSGDNKLQGVAILSRWPITSTNSLILADRRNPAGAVRAVIQDRLTQRQVAVVGTQVTGTDDQTRLRQVVTLVNLIGDVSPTVVAADLEKPPEDVAYQQLLSAGFVDPDVSLGIERGFTFPALDPTIRRDYLLVRGLVPLASRQVDRSGSNHRLVVIEAGWP